MKRIYESNWLWVSLVIIIVIIFSALATGCGSGGSGGGSYDGQIKISCADVQETFNGSCEADPVLNKPGALKALAVLQPNAVFSSGLLNTSATLSAEIEVSNGQAKAARVYLFNDMFGICGRLNSMQSKTFEMNPASLKMVQSIGSNFSACALPGPAYYEVFIYNASHLPLDEYSGDPSIDEVLYSARVEFDFKTP